MTKLRLAGKVVFTRQPVSETESLILYTKSGLMFYRTQTRKEETIRRPYRVLVVTLYINGHGHKNVYLLPKNEAKKRHHDDPVLSLGVENQTFTYHRKDYVQSAEVVKRHIAVQETLGSPVTPLKNRGHQKRV